MTYSGRGEPPDRGLNPFLARRLIWVPLSRCSQQVVLQNRIQGCTLTGCRRASRFLALQRIEEEGAAEIPDWLPAGLGGRGAFSDPWLNWC